MRLRALIALLLAALILASVNIFGGFLVTQRMLEMFKPSAPKAGKDEPKEPQA